MPMTRLYAMNFEEFRIETGDEFLLFFPPFLSVVIRFLKVGYAFA